MSDQRFQGTSKYIASAELIEIVNVAVALGRPLLIRGEPGTGKTLLASSVSEALDMPLHTWHVKSTSKARDGLYVYDTVQRLNDSRFGDGEDVKNIDNYIKMGPLGEAFRTPTRSVVLIDEIDKAELEFPNDLLHELDAMSFTVDETSEVVTANIRPVVIITSNAEKELPDAFLRRCIFHYISFPDPGLMEDIIKVHHPDLSDKLIGQCLARFYSIRDLPDIRKRPSTSELIDWIGALRKSGLDEKDIREQLPFAGVLFKRESDLQTYQYRQR